MAAKKEVSPSSIFKKALGEIADVLGAEPNFTTVTNFLIGEELISMPELKLIKSKNFDDNQKGTEVAQLLVAKLDAVDDAKEAGEILEKICEIFEKKKVDNQILKKVATEMRKKLKQEMFSVAVAESDDGSITFKESNRAEKESDDILEPNDLGRIMDIIDKDLQTHYKKLGQSLKLTSSQITNIEKQYGRDDIWSALNEVVKEWLDCNFIRPNKEYPTKKWLVEVVAKINHRLAEKLEKEL